MYNRLIILLLSRRRFSTLIARMHRYRPRSQKWGRNHEIFKSFFTAGTLHHGSTQENASRRSIFRPSSGVGRGTDKWTSATRETSLCDLLGRNRFYRIAKAEIFCEKKRNGNCPEYSSTIIEIVIDEDTAREPRASMSRCFEARGSREAESAIGHPSPRGHEWPSSLKRCTISW